MNYSGRLNLSLSLEQARARCRAALEVLKWDVRQESEDAIKGVVRSERWAINAEFILTLQSLSSGPRAETQVIVTVDAPEMKEDLLEVLPRPVAELFAAISASTRLSLGEKPAGRLLTSGSSRPFGAFSFGTLGRAKSESTADEPESPPVLGPGDHEPSRGDTSPNRDSSNAPAEGGTSLMPEATRDSTRKARLFLISYRREDTPDITGRIYDRLVQRFGPETIFKDVDSIPLGVDFKRHLEAQVEQCDVLLAVIGKTWLKNKKGKRRLDDPHDFVRIEIASALRRDIPVIPLMVSNARMPSEADLPEDLRGLVFRNFIQIRPDPDFHNDMNRLIKELEAQP